MASGNGTKILRPIELGRELRVRLSPQHMQSLAALAHTHGWQGATACAEALLSDAIERAARNTVFRQSWANLMLAWQRGRVR